jgi:transposase
LVVASQVGAEDWRPAGEASTRGSIVDGILYVVRTGCAWRYLPADFPPWQTVYRYFKQWEQAKVTEVMLAALREQARVQQGRNPQPSAGIIDSQSVKGAADDQPLR